MAAEEKLSHQEGFASSSRSNDTINPTSPIGPDHISILPPNTASEDLKARRRIQLSFTNVNDHPQATSAYKHSNTQGLAHRPGHFYEGSEGNHDKETQHIDSYQPYYLTRHTTGRNAQFHHLTREEREHLGGVEYRALTFLSILVPLYWFLWQILGCVGLAAYFAHNKPDVPLQNGINPWCLSPKCEVLVDN